MKFSVIIPAYNSQNFLKRAVNSVLCQTYEDYELIIVNDGSTDKTLSIAEAFAKENENVRYLDKENGGLSSARNAGIKAAKGEYLVFLDSDDKLHSKNLLFKIANYTNKAKPDLIIGNIQAVTNNNQKFLISSNLDLIIKRSSSIEEIITAYVNKNRQPPWMSFQTIVNRQFLNNSKVAFDEKIPTQEDLFFFFQIAQKNPSVKLVKDIFVDYTYLREGSITSTLNYQNVMNALINFARVFDDLSFNYQIKKYIGGRYADYVPSIFLLDKKHQKICLNFVESKKYILKTVNYTNKKYILYKGLWNIFGLKLGSKIILIIKKIFK